MSDKHNPRKGKPIVFADDQERVIYPLTIRSLRKFVKVVEKMGDVESAMSMSDEDIDLMVEAASIILEKVDKALAADPEAVEDAVDLDIFQQMMSVAMGSSSPEE